MDVAETMGLGVKSVDPRVDVGRLLSAISSTSRRGVSVGCSSSAES